MEDSRGSLEAAGASAVGSGFVMVMSSSSWSMNEGGMHAVLDLDPFNENGQDELT